MFVNQNLFRKRSLYQGYLICYKANGQIPSENAWILSVSDEASNESVEIFYIHCINALISYRVWYMLEFKYAIVDYIV